MCATASLHREMSSPRTLKWTDGNRVQITYNTSGAYHVQRAVCHMARRDSSAIKFDRFGMVLILAVFRWLKPLIRGGGEKTGVPIEKLRR